MTVKKYATIPNLMSLFRIILIPIFVVVYLNTADTTTIAWWPILILALSGLTDFFDGMIARKFIQVSDLGKMLDPVADKLTQVAVIACLAFRYPQLWILLGFYVIKEISMMIGGLVMLKGKRRQVPSARWYGKVATFELYTAMLLLLLFPQMSNGLVTAIVVITAGLALFALIMYAMSFFNFNNKGDNK